MEFLPDFQLLRPATVAEAVALRAIHDSAQFIAGGTDLLVSMRRGLVDVAALIDLSGIAEIRQIQAAGSGLRIGAGVTLQALIDLPEVNRDYPVLARAASAVAGPTHRGVATVGGNLCLDTRCRYYNQSEPWRAANDYCLKHRGDTCRVAPKSDRCYAAFSGDLAPALLVLGAEVDLAGSAGTRRIPLAGMYADDGKSFLRLSPGEMLTAVHVPLTPGLNADYEKVRVRDAVDYPLVGIAASLKQDGECIGRLAIAITGAAAQPLLIAGLDDLAGARLDDIALDRIERLIKQQITVMETTVMTSQYRRRVACVLARRLIRKLYRA